MHVSTKSASLMIDPEFGRREFPRIQVLSCGLDKTLPCQPVPEGPLDTPSRCAYMAIPREKLVEFYPGRRYFSMLRGEGVR